MDSSHYRGEKNNFHALHPSSQIMFKVPYQLLTMNSSVRLAPCTMMVGLCFQRRRLKLPKWTIRKMVGIGLLEKPVISSFPSDVVGYLHLKCD